MQHPKRRRAARLATSAFLAVALLAALTSAPAAATAAAEAEEPDTTSEPTAESATVDASPQSSDRSPVTSEDLAQDLNWQACNQELTEATGTVFECASIKVPLDYDTLDDFIELPLVRIPASDPGNRQGAILANPGGPGGSGISFVLGFGPLAGLFFGPEVPAQFDLVGFDPRGIGQSAPLRCFDTADEAVEVFPPTAFPLTLSELRDFARGDAALARACLTYPGAKRLAEHMSTANVARDMDVIRASMGDASLNFLGLSYGTYVAATYANLFPERVRAVVADGVLDPVAWVNKEAKVPFSTRLRSDEGAQETLEEFFVQCEAAAPGNCAFAPDPSARYDALAERLLESPIEIDNPVTGGATPFTYQDLIGFSLGNLYNPFSYASMAQGLAFFESIAFAPEGQAAPEISPAVLAYMEEEPYENFVEGFPGVGCVDTNNPRSYLKFARAGVQADAEYGYFGRLWTWSASPCILWPYKDKDRYEGPFTAVTAAPVLAIGNLYDPATRYEGAQALRALLPNSALLTVDAPGHTSLGVSLCAGAATGQYFLDPAVAATLDGFTCPSEYNAFDVVAAPAPASQSATAEDGTAVSVRSVEGAELDAMIDLRAAVLPQAGLVPPMLSAPVED